MREKLYDFLSERPSGATARELLDLVLQQAGSSEAVGEKVLQALLEDDPRFEWRVHSQSWAVVGSPATSGSIWDTEFVVFDLETTDQTRGVSSIVEFGAVRIRAGKVVDTFEQLVNPNVKLSPFVAKLTGIDDALLATQPQLSEAWPRVAEFIGTSPLVAHNAAYDLSCLNTASVACTGRRLDNDHICTFKVARRLLPDMARRGLDSLAGHFGVPTSDRHRALADAKLTAEIFFHLMEQLRAEGVESFEQLLEYQDRASDGQPFVCGLPRDKVVSLPELPGVYRLLGENGEVLYVGRAKSLRDRVGDYLNNVASHGDKTLELIRNARDLRVEVLGSELEAALHEADTIRAEQPPYNKLAKHLPRIAFVRLHLRDRFPRLSVSAKVRAGADRYVGPFRSRKEAGQVVELLSKIFKLRTCPHPLRPEPTFVPCAEAAQARCTAPCAERVDTAEYAEQVSACLRFVETGQEAPAGRSLSGSDHRALRALERLRRGITWLAEEAPSFLVLQPAVGTSAVLVYFAHRGELLLRRRLQDESEVEALASQIEKLTAKGGGSHRGEGERAEGSTIIAAWLREREPNEGYVIPINDGIGRELVDEIRAACASLLMRA